MVETEVFKRREERRKPGDAAGENGTARRPGFGPVGAFEKVGRAAGNAVGAIDKGERVRGGGCQFGGDEGEVGAGENDGVEPVSAGLGGEAGDGIAEDCGIGCFAAQLRFGGLHQGGRAVAQHRAARRKPGAEIIHIGLADGGLGAQHADDAGFRLFGGGLDGGHCADDGDRKHRADMAERDGGRCVAGDDDDGGAQPFGEAAQQACDAGGDFGFAFGAIGKARRIGAVNQRRPREARCNCGEDGKAAYPGIEEQDGARSGGFLEGCGRQTMRSFT